MGGKLTLEGRRLAVELRGLIGERPATLKGTIDNPGPDAVVRLRIQAESVPIDDAFLAALRPRPEILKVVNDFHPSGSFKADVRVQRDPTGRADGEGGRAPGDRRRSGPQPAM